METGAKGWRGSLPTLCAKADPQMTDVFEGIKTIQIQAATRYPIVSAYEFEFLKSEAEIKDLLRPCTVYFIVQRPLTYIGNLHIEDGLINFEITDGSENQPLQCSFEPQKNGFGKAGEELLIDIQFYKRKPDTAAPFNDVAGIKLFDLNSNFLVWLTPQKFLYEYLSGNLKATVTGQLSSYIDYEVHYIGKAFSQDIWERLTGHHKMQSILTLEDALSDKATKASFEISLIMLDIDGFVEANLFPEFRFALRENVTPIIHRFTFDNGDDSFEKYFAPKLGPKAEELTNEVEAMLISCFKPEYNQIKFDNYPNIKKGTRSAGYTESSLLLERLPAKLFTKHHTQDSVLPKSA